MATIVVSLIKVCVSGVSKSMRRLADNEQDANKEKASSQEGNYPFILFFFLPKTIHYSISKVQLRKSSSCPAAINLYRLCCLVKTPKPPPCLCTPTLLTTPDMVMQGFELSYWPYCDATSSSSGRSAVWPQLPCPAQTQSTLCGVISAHHRGASLMNS